MMAKRKRAPGGGRKRLGPSVAQNLTIRIDSEMRERLQAEADKRRARNWNLSQEILMRLGQSLDRQQRNSRQRNIDAICYAISQLVDNESVFDPAWHRNPFLFRAFRLAVDKVLSRIEPPGEIKALHHLWPTPEDLAQLMSYHVLFQLFHSGPRTFAFYDPSGNIVGYPPDTADGEAELYGWDRARRHLGIEKKEERGK